MKTKILTAALIVLAFFSLAFAYQPKQWEYKTEFHGTMSEKKLNQIGAEGWELVTVAKDPMNSVQTFYFKRAKVTP